MAVYRKAARDKVVVRSYGGAGWLAAPLDLERYAARDGETANMMLSVFTFDCACRWHAGRHP